MEAERPTAQVSGAVSNLFVLVIMGSLAVLFCAIAIAMHLGWGSAFIAAPDFEQGRTIATAFAALYGVGVPIASLLHRDAWVRLHWNETEIGIRYLLIRRQPVVLLWTGIRSLELRGRHVDWDAALAELERCKFLDSIDMTLIADEGRIHLNSRMFARYQLGGLLTMLKSKRPVMLNSKMAPERP
ncbi:MAG: hypothetical protein NTW87_26885 [Planctomycetota bacterium]|nr:hypothetical protein [Planctomycetota bacterium]